MPAKRTRKPNSVASSPASDQPGASEDVAEEMCQSLPAEAMSREALVPQRQERPVSAEMLSLWNNARWYQIPLSSLRRPKAGLFSCMFQASLQAYQQLRKSKRLKVGRPFSVLPLPDLPSLLTDCARDASHKQHDRHSCSRARGAKDHKSRKGPLGRSQQMPVRARKHRAVAPPLPERYVVCSGAPRQREEEEPRSASGVNALDLDPGGLSPLSSPECALLEATGGGRSANLWAAGCSPFGEAEEEDADADMFPPDWTPPRVEFLYHKDLPALSPAPRDASESRSSWEVPDGTEEPLGAKAASSTGDHSPPLAGAAALQPRSLWEVGSGDGSGSGDSAPLDWGVAKQQREGGSPAYPVKGEIPSAPDPGQSPPPLAVPPGAPSSPVCSPSGLSPSSEQRVGCVESLGLEVGAAVGSTPPPLPPPSHPLMTCSRTSSGCRISATSGVPSSNLENLVLGSDLEEDLGDRDLVPLSDLFERRGGTSQSTVKLSTGACSALDSYLSSLDKLLEEKRGQTWEDKEPERSLGENLLLSSSLYSGEAADKSIDTFPEAHRLLLEQFSISRGRIPGVHPGESIFLRSPPQRLVPSLDTAGLNPRNLLESLFFRSNIDQQMAFLQDGFLGSLYLGLPHCPHRVLRWLFQLMSFNTEVSADAFQVLWEISARQLASADEVGPGAWCPKLQDIAQALYNLGACESALNPAGLVQLTFRHKDLQSSKQDLGSAHMKNKSPSQEALRPRSLAVMLGDIFKFLTLCVASRPLRYSGPQRLALLVLLCRLGLDRNLRKQPLVELQQLLLVLLEAVQHWQEELPELCRLLCRVSQHHHNLVAVVRLFPDTTARGRHLRRNLSLGFITKLLGKMQMVMAPWQGEVQLQQLGHLLPLMKPAALQRGLQQVQSLQGPPRKEPQEGLPELDEQACYLCYSLLTLANGVVGTSAGPAREQGPLQQLCVQLQQHISASIREDPSLMYRTELKNLAAQTYVKWQGLLPQTWLQQTPQQGPNKNI